jgi:hypothetical protein
MTRTLRESSFPDAAEGELLLGRGRELLEPVARVIRTTWIYGVLAVYGALVFYLVPHHEPWFDEAQAWLIARDVSPQELFVHYLRYEGTPGLWHLLLMVPAKLHLPYQTLNVISASFGVLGTYLFLRHSPFPWYVKLLFPFSFYVFYQYAIVARSYSLLPVLFFLLAVTYRSKMQSPFRFAIALILLANVSIHALIVATCVLGIHAWDVRVAWAQLDRSLRRRQLLACALFGATAVLLVLVLSPPPDIFGPGTSFSPSVERFVLISLRILNAATAEQRPVLIAVVALTALWCWRTRTLWLIGLPALAMLGFLTIKYYNVWHEGVLFLVWVFVLWVGLERWRGRVDRRLEMAMMAVLAVVLAFQAVWSAKSYLYDYSNPYSGSTALAAYIKQNHLEGRKIDAARYSAISVEPYFDHNLFANYHHGGPPTFFYWSTHEQLSQEQTPIFQQVVTDRPDYVVYADKFTWDPHNPELPGYRIVAHFPGRIYWKNRFLENDNYVLYQRLQG